MEEILLLSMFLIVDLCLSCEDTARQSCAMVPRWRIFGDFLHPVFSTSRVQHISDLYYSKLVPGGTVVQRVRHLGLRSVGHGFKSCSCNPATLRNNLRQVVYTYVPLSPSSRPVTSYRPKGSDALRCGGNCRPGGK